MKCLVTIAFLLLIIGRTHAAGSGVDGPNADLIYDPATGNVVLDGSKDPCERIYYFELITSGPAHIFDLNSFMIPYAVSNDIIPTPNDLAAVDLTLTGLPRMDIGPILPLGLGPDDFVDYFSLTLYACAPIGVGPTGHFDLVVIPEPIAIEIMVMSVLSFLFIRRWQAAWMCAKRRRGS